MTLSKHLAKLVQMCTWFACLIACLALAAADSVQAQTAGRQILAGHVPQAVSQSKVLGAVPAASRLNFSFGLPLRNQAQLDSYLAELSDPSSPNYRHYLTPEQFAAEYGPTEEDYQKLVSFAQKSGFAVTGTHANRVMLDVAGAVSDVENALQVKMTRYRDQARGEFFAPDREPSVELDVQVLKVVGLDNYSVPQPMDLRAAPLSANAQSAAGTTGSGPGGYFIGKDFRAAYAPGVTLTGSGQTVGLVEFDGFYASDVQANFAAAGLPAVPMQTVLLDGVSGTPGANNPEDTLDIMMAAYMAPGLSKIIVYEGASWDSVLNRMATDNLAKQLSSSWGGAQIDAVGDQIFKQFAAQGQSFLQASGDDGAYGASNPVMPPSDYPLLTCVGGTHLTTGGPAGPWSAESAWPGSGGGISTTYSIPSYQQGISMAASGGSSKMRNFPDVATLADPQTYLIVDNGQAWVIGGTSQATPLWAGFVALANQQAASNGLPSLGFLNPSIYSIAASGSYSSDFHDIRTGSNGFNAVAGYDLATGWGSPVGQPLINDLVGAESGKFTISSSSGALTVTRGSAVSATLTVSGGANLKNSVALTVSGLPNGVTASFSPSSTSSSSTLTLQTTTAAAPGTYNLIVTGTSGTQSSTAAISLTINAPSFSLAASPSSLTVMVGGTSGASTITITGHSGFTGSVALSAPALPPGVTATFSSASATATSALSFKASTLAVPGIYPVTVSGTSGSLSSSTTVTLTIPQPSFSLSVSVGSLTLLPGGTSAASTIGITDQNGFTGSVALTISGLPGGVTAAFSSASASASSSVTFKATTAVLPGTYPVTITGTSGALSAKTGITLTVPTPSFGLSASPGSLSLLVGATSASTTVSVTNPVNMTSGVALVVSGLPTGVTATFSPTSTTSTSTLTFKSSTAAAPGTYAIKISGVSGTASATANITLTIPQPSFSLSASVPNLPLLVGGTSAASTITITDQNGFTGSVALSASGLPNGVMATFSSTVASTSSSVTFKASTAVVPGVYPVTVTGSSGNLSNKTTITLTVPAPGFGLAASPNSLTLLVGTASASSTITVTNPVNLTGSVALSVTGLPTGISATLSSASTTTSSTLTFKSSTAVVPGTYTVTVTGTADSVSSAATIKLTVPQPSFSLSTSAATLTLKVGGTSSASTISIAGENGFASSVSLTVSGLPSGATAVFSSTATTNTSSLTFKTGAATVPGTYSVVVTGTSGKISSTVTISLVISAH